ncbi:hypothetical protein L6452_08764 [Arctium lappa]|uniref:Uncharacterized protein n=1 Tax=Arctium lappa TaxID=4217 RepID=A0ACB9DJA8_ARCLA|nr:hypothetical protein L6452_08764 [Arctium lappa]
MIRRLHLSPCTIDASALKWSNSKIQVTNDMDADPHSFTKEVELTGSAEPIAKVEQLIKDVFAEVNDEIRSSKQGGICIDKDATFNEGGDLYYPKTLISFLLLLNGGGC